MSEMLETAARGQTKEALPWSLWLRQTGAILRLELKKNLWGKRAFLLYLLALLPIMLMTALSIFPPDEVRDPIERNLVFANIYAALILRTVVFFGCAWIFMNLFRGDIVDRSLHYYFLSPVRREVLVAGKYLSGLLASMLLFVTTTVVSMLLLYVLTGGGAYLMNGAGLNQLLTYAGITALACLGYGAFFLVVGLFFRNPIIPALIMYGWEWLNFLLPPVLKKISVIHYLNSLSPLPVNEGPFAILVEPTPAWISVPGLLFVTAMVLGLASLQIRRMEIRYGGE
ncbi:MAG: type transport system permease protein [Blastocatellia bacterium]|jgi:ABC-type transport system involved in multi-copper enzyme maturation permease subunit|nr:type transport system permease protein [Blastocatellia bacterium]